MKILFLANKPLIKIEKENNLKLSYSGGWIDSLVSLISDQDKYEVVFCFCSNLLNKSITNQVNDLKYYGITTINQDNLISTFKQIIEKESPDIVHIFGTEFYHTLAMIKAFNNPDKTVLHIQGLKSIYAKHYNSNLPNKILKHRTFRDFIRRDSILKQQRLYKKNGINEMISIQDVNHIAGRTDWDLACIKQINDKAFYHVNDEILRDVFYHEKWSIKNCRKHSIFVSQSKYPIKGFHNVIEALSIIKQKYSDVEVYVAGKSLVDNKRYKQTEYQKYIKRLIKKYDLEKNIIFTGVLSENEMCLRYLKSHVFVAASSIENSPNSVAEAMILGMPVVSSYVGGVMSMLAHNNEGFLFQSDAPYMLAHYVMELFANDILAANLGSNARKVALKRHDKETIMNQVEKMYERM